MACREAHGGMHVRISKYSHPRSVGKVVLVGSAVGAVIVFLFHSIMYPVLTDLAKPGTDDWTLRLWVLFFAGGWGLVVIALLVVLVVWTFCRRRLHREQQDKERQVRLSVGCWLLDVLLEVAHTTAAEAIKLIEDPESKRPDFLALKKKLHEYLRDRLHKLAELDRRLWAQEKKQTVLHALMMPEQGMSLTNQTKSILEDLAVRIYNPANRPCRTSEEAKDHVQEALRGAREVRQKIARLRQECADLDPLGLTEGKKAGGWVDGQ